MIKQQLKFLFILLFFIFFTLSCFNDKSINNSKKLENTKNEVISNDDKINLDLDLLEDNISIYRQSGENFQIKDDIINGNFDSSNNKIDLIIKKIDDKKELTKNDKINKVSLKYLKVSNLLNKGNYFYEEEKYSKEAIKIIEDIILQEPDFIDPFYNNYYLGYSNEITKDYTGALNYYNKALEYAGNGEKNKKLKSIILNQIGHLYDLKGDLEKAYSFYYKSYYIYNINPENLINLGRYFVRKNNFESAKTYFESAINLSNNNLLKSEIYYNLSSISLYSNIKNKLNISLDYANKSIKYNKNSPLGYLGKARIFILKWENLNEAENILKKSIEIHPNFSTSYEWLGILEQGRGFYNKSVTYFLKSLETIPNDIILMEHEKRNNLARVNYLLSVTLALGKNKEMTIKHLNQMFILKDDISLTMFINEINKKDYGNFSYLKGYKEFEKIVSLLK